MCSWQLAESGIPLGCHLSAFSSFWDYLGLSAHHLFEVGLSLDSLLCLDELASDTTA